MAHSTVSVPIFDAQVSII